jgi:D-3-phosphoglycerate dehydrogenase
VKTVLQVEYVGDMAPYDYETSELATIGARLEAVRGSGPEAVLEAAQDADVIWLEWTPQFTRELLGQLPRCGLVVRWGVGYDQIDVAAATALGIAVGNAATYCTPDVAEHALALLLSVSRQVVFRHEQMRAGQWRAGEAAARRVAGSTIGVVGLGRIGRRMAGLCNALGAHVLGYDPAVTDVPGIEQVDLAELLGRSDYVTVHVPLSDATRHLIRSETLELMRPDAVLINTSRGGIVRQDDLVAALQSGRIAAAALDVFEQEPLPADAPIRAVPNAVLTPHEAAFSPQSMTDLRREMVATTVEWLTTGWAGAVVNPQVREHPRLSRAGA